jgi:hypothetical protein
MNCYRGTDIDDAINAIRRELESIKDDNPQMYIRVESGPFDMIEITYDI